MGGVLLDTSLAVGCHSLTAAVTRSTSIHVNASTAQLMELHSSETDKVKDNSDGFDLFQESSMR